MELIINNGKLVPPKTVEKVKAAVTGNKQCVIQLPFEEIQQMVATELWNQCKWLHKYKSARLSYNKEIDNFMITFTKE